MARDQTPLHGLDHGCRDYGNVGGGLLRGNCRGGVAGHKNVRPELDQFACEFWQTCKVAFGKPRRCVIVATFDVAERLHLLGKRSEKIWSSPPRCPKKERDQRPSNRLLCAHRERPRRRAAEQPDELAPPHGAPSRTSTPESTLSLGSCRRVRNAHSRPPTISATIVNATIGLALSLRKCVTLASLTGLC